MPEKLPESNTELMTLDDQNRAVSLPGGPLPSLVLEVGQAGERAWDDFFEGSIPNANTRIAYERAVRYFLTWAQTNVPDKSLPQIGAGDVGRYMRGLSGSLQKKKQHLAGLGGCVATERLSKDFDNRSYRATIVMKSTEQTK